MAIDTQAKRGSAIATRRLPWFRRFMPLPDGSMTQADRQQLAFVYGGILAGEAVPDVGPTAPGLEYRPTGTRLHYRPRGG